MTEKWRDAWRRGFAPQFSGAGLEALAKALETDDHRLIQGATIDPPPLACVSDWPVEAACATAYCGWKGDGLETVAEVEEYFAQVCYKVDESLGEPASCRWFLNFFDETPRNEMRRQLLAEVNDELERRAQSA